MVLLSEVPEIHAYVTERQAVRVTPAAKSPRSPRAGLPVGAVVNNRPMRITLLSGGMGGSRFAQGVLDDVTPSETPTIVASTADDITLYGLRICPDLDTVMYTLAGGIEPVRRGGRTDETWNAKA